MQRKLMNKISLEKSNDVGKGIRTLIYYWNITLFPQLR